MLRVQRCECRRGQQRRAGGRRFVQLPRREHQRAEACLQAEVLGEQILLDPVDGAREPRAPPLRTSVGRRWAAFALLQVAHAKGLDIRPVRSDVGA